MNTVNSIREILVGSNRQLSIERDATVQFPCGGNQTTLIRFEPHLYSLSGSSRSKRNEI